MVDSMNNKNNSECYEQSMTRDIRQNTLAGSGKDGKRALDHIDWTFEGVDTQKYTHGLHNYPARMVPQIVSRLLDFYLTKGIIHEGDLVYDPFAGSGTTLVESRLHGLNAEGNDINPFAVMLSKAKSIPLPNAVVNESREYLLDGLQEQLRTIEQAYSSGEIEGIQLPDVNDGWFPQPQLYQLSAIRDQIDAVEEQFGEDVARFYRIVLAHTTRKVSYQRNGEFKRYRMSESDRETHDPDVYSIFTDKLTKNVQMMRKYANAVDSSLDTSVHYADSRSATDQVGENKADIVITSPPYGDHKTTVAYGEFSQDPTLLTGEATYDEMRYVDKEGLGGKNSSLDPMSDLREYSSSLDKTLEALENKDGRSEDALNFFTDYFAVMKEVAKVTKSDQPVIWVVANRTMSRVSIPAQLITSELCKHLGYEHVNTLPREIPNKTLPWENAPENIPGTKGELMANENLVVMKAP